MKTCPECGGELEFSYGLAGGGMGAYEWCKADACDYFHKDRECLFCDALLAEGKRTCGDSECERKGGAEVTRG